MTTFSCISRVLQSWAGFLLCISLRGETQLEELCLVTWPLFIFEKYMWKKPVCSEMVEWRFLKSRNWPSGESIPRFRRERFDWRFSQFWDFSKAEQRRLSITIFFLSLFLNPKIWNLSRDAALDVFGEDASEPEREKKSNICVRYDIWLIGNGSWIFFSSKSARDGKSGLKR